MTLFMPAQMHWESLEAQAIVETQMQRETAHNSLLLDDETRLIVDPQAHLFVRLYDLTSTLLRLQHIQIMEWHTLDVPYSIAVHFYLAMMETLDSEEPRSWIHDLFEQYQPVLFGSQRRQIPLDSQRSIFSTIFAMYAVGQLEPTYLERHIRAGWLAEVALWFSEKSNNSLVFEGGETAVGIRNWHLSHDRSHPSEIHNLIEALAQDLGLDEIESEIQQWIDWEAEDLREIPEAWRERLVKETLHSRKQPKNLETFVDQAKNRLNLSKRSEIKLLSPFYFAFVSALSQLLQKTPVLLEQRILAEREEKRQEEERELNQLQRLEEIRPLLLAAFEEVIDPYFLNRPGREALLEDILVAVVRGEMSDPFVYREGSQAHAWLLYVLKSYLQVERVRGAPDFERRFALVEEKIARIKVKVEHEHGRISTRLPVEKCKEAMLGI